MPLRLARLGHALKSKDIRRPWCMGFHLVAATAPLHRRGITKNRHLLLPHTMQHHKCVWGCAGEGGARVWNTQLLRYAGYRQDDMSVLGDPSELQFTELVQRKFGWRPPGT